MSQIKEQVFVQKKIEIHHTTVLPIIQTQEGASTNP